MADGVTQIPPHIAANIMEFLRRAKCDGIEALAWVEAYSCMQQHAPPSKGQSGGVPFNGLQK
jgi:hypothetical protein